MSEPTLHTCWICGEKSPERHVLVDCAIAEKAKRDSAKKRDSEDAAMDAAIERALRGKDRP